MSLHDYAKKHKMKDYDKSFKMIRNIKEEPGLLLNQSKKEPSEKPPTDEISRTYSCEICNFETKYNFNLAAHYKTLKHITNAKSKGEITENVEPNQNKDASNEIIVEAVETNGNGPDSRKRQAPFRSVNSEMFFWCLQIDQKPNEIFLRISALASKQRSNQKSTLRESK